MGILDKFNSRKVKEEPKKIIKPQTSVGRTIPKVQPPQYAGVAAGYETQQTPQVQTQPEPQRPQVQQPLERDEETANCSDEFLILELKRNSRRLHFIETKYLTEQQKSVSEFRENGKDKMQEYDYLNEADTLKYLLQKIINELNFRGYENQVQQLIEESIKGKEGYEFELR